MVVFDDGTGPALVVGGNYTQAGGMPAPRLASWRCVRPQVAFTQAGGPGSGTTISVTNLVPGLETFNIYSLSPCPGPPGSGPLLGLCAATPNHLQFLIDQTGSGTLKVTHLAGEN